MEMIANSPWMLESSVIPGSNCPSHRADSTQAADMTGVANQAMEGGTAEETMTAATRIHLRLRARIQLQPAFTLPDQRGV